MHFINDRFRPSGFSEIAKLFCTFLGALAQIALNITLSVFIGRSFRDHAPWAFYLAIALACAWSSALLVLVMSFVRLVTFLNKNSEILRNQSRSALVLPLGLESFAAALGSALLSSAVVWQAYDIRTTENVADRDFGQFDIYFPISVGFQVLALPGFVKLADIFGYASAKAKKELQTAQLRSEISSKKSALQSINTGGSSLISAESIRAAQKEINQAKARLAAQEKALHSVSTGGSAQSIGPSQRVFTRPRFSNPDMRILESLGPSNDRKMDRVPYRFRGSEDGPGVDTLPVGTRPLRHAQPDDDETRIDIAGVHSAAQARKAWF